MAVMADFCLLPPGYIFSELFGICKELKICMQDMRKVSFLGKIQIHVT